VGGKTACPAVPLKLKYRLQKLLGNTAYPSEARKSLTHAGRRDAGESMESQANKQIINKYILKSRQVMA
jgi:hypothetical protein